MVAVNLNVVDRGRLAKSTMRRLRTVTAKYKVQNRNQTIAGKLSAGSEVTVQLTITSSVPNLHEH